MANKRLDYDKIYELVMQCRQSGLSDKQWCLDNNIAPSTFYYWIRRLQQKACYNLPEARRNDIPAVAVKQDVVCVNIQPDSATKVVGLKVLLGICWSSRTGKSFSAHVHCALR